MSMIGQRILIREDLQFPTGLLAAQVAHIHALPLIEALKNGAAGEAAGNAFESWIDAPYLFVHGAPNVEVLSYLVKKAEEAKIPVLTWSDTVYLKVGDETVPFENVLIGASFGPADSDKLKMVFGTLDLLR